MAADKKTLLREALKQIQAGKIDKAVGTYRAIIKLDPRDAAVRNSVADLLGRQGKKKDAIAEYLEASSLYEKDGFIPRAIAVCQKIVKLDGEQWGVRLKLGDLYAAQKLPAEARAVYLQIADRHDKRGEVAAALEIFRRIADLEPGNLPVRVKLAGMFEKQKQPEQAAEEYVRAAKGYAARQEKDASAQLLVRAFKLSPANIEARLMLADFYAQRQEWQVVIGLLETPVARGTADAAQTVIYAEALTRVNHPREAVVLLEKLQAAEPNAVPVNLALGRAYLKTGEIEKGAAALNRCVGAHLAENRLEAAESLLRELSAAVPEDDRVLQRIIEVTQKRGDAAASSEAYLKLAAVFERKGLARNAAGALERYLEIRPADPTAMQRLEALRAAASAPAAPPAVAPVAAPAVAQAPEPASPAKAAPPREAAAVLPGDEIEIEDDVDLAELAAVGEEELVVEDEEEIPEIAAEAGEEEPLTVPLAAAGTAPEMPPAEEELIEISLEEEEIPEAPAGPEVSELPAEEYGEISLAEPPAEEEAAAPPAQYGEIALDEPAVETHVQAAPLGEPEGPEQEPTEAAAVAEAAEVAEPGVPEALVFESFDGALADLDAIEAAPAPAATAPETVPETVPEPVPEPETASEAAPEVQVEAPPAETLPPAAAPAEIDPTMAEADFYFQQGLLDEAESLYAQLDSRSPGSPAIAAQLAMLREQRAVAPPSPVEPNPMWDLPGLEETVPAAATPGGGGGDFEDFLGDLRQELESQGELVPPPLEEAGLNEIFQEFQRSVKEQLGDEDYETHYNLGIAYKEMGLTEEAIGEFTLAEKSPARSMDAVSMIALCLREQGRLDEAAQRLRTGVALAAEGSEQQKGLLYDLAAVNEQAGRADLAAEALQRLYAMDAGYRDVASRIGAAPPPAPSRRKPKVSYL